jgi:hypothetical protein
VATITTINDYEDYTGVDSYDAGQQVRIEYWIGQAERYLRRMTGWTWYDSEHTDSDASQDWLLASCIVAERSLIQESPEYKAAIASPYQSERLGDYQYTMKGATANASSSALLDPDPRVADLIAQYSMISALPFSAVVLAGPTRVAVPILDSDPDVSRDEVWGLEISER